MLSEQTDSFNTIVCQKLSAYGLNKEEVLLYLFLLENGSKSALEISRKLPLTRTTVYRVLDKLIEKNLVIKELQSAGLRFLPSPPENLDYLLETQAQQLKQLTTGHQQLVQELESLGGQFQRSGSEVRYYSGLSGLKQVTRNSLEAKKQLLIYELNQDMSKFVDYEFAEEVRHELAERQTTVFQLTNLTEILPHTEATKLVEHFWKPRYISPKEFKIQFEVLIYNDVYALYTYEKGEAFCVEVHNVQLAKMQRQLFSFVWKRAKPLVLLDRFGAAKLIPLDTNQSAIHHPHPAHTARSKNSHNPS